MSGTDGRSYYFCGSREFYRDVGTHREGHRARRMLHPRFSGGFTRDRKRAGHRAKDRPARRIALVHCGVRQAHAACEIAEPGVRPKSIPALIYCEENQLPLPLAKGSLEPRKGAVSLTE